MQRDLAPMEGALGLSSASPLLSSLISSSQATSPQKGACSRHFSSRPLRKAGKSVTTLMCSVSSALALAYMEDWIVERSAGRSSLRPAFLIVSFSPVSLLTATYVPFFMSLGPTSSLMGTPLSSQWLNLAGAVVLPHVGPHPDAGGL